MTLPIEQVNVPVTSDRPRRPSGAPWVAPCRGLKPPARRKKRAARPRSQGSRGRAWVRSPSLHLSRFSRPGAPPAPGGHTPSRGEAHRGTHPVASPRPGRPATATKVPTSSLAVQGWLSRQSLRGGVPPPRRLGHARCTAGGAGFGSGGSTPRCPPSARLTARSRARFARLRQRIAPRMRGGANCHRLQFQLRPAESPAPSGAVNEDLRPRSREQRIRRRTL